MIYVESIRGYPYMNLEKLAGEFSLSKSTIRNRLEEIEKQIANGRYSDYSILRDGKIVLVNVLVFIDYMRYRQQLLDRNARKYTPEFRPSELIECIGWNNKVIREVDGDEKKNSA